MLRVIKYPNKILRQKAKPVVDFDDDLKNLAEQIAELMHEDDGIGLAALQVDKNKRLFVVGNKTGSGYQAYVNPEISFFSKAKQVEEEGCLSLPLIFGLVSRAKKIHLKYQDLQGKVHKEKIKGFPAVVIQHELDHLDGVLFIDRAEKITQGEHLLENLKKSDVKTS